MALAEIQALKDLAKEMGIEEGPELTAFLRDEQAKAREMRQAEQEKADRAREQQQESADRAREQQQEADNRAREAADRATELQQEADNRDREAADRARELQQEADNKDREAANRARDQEHALRLAEIQRDTARETADRHDAIQIREDELADRRAATRTMPKLHPFDDKNDDMDAFIRRL